MQIYPAAERPAQDVDPQYFTGEVSMQPLVTAPAPARLRGVSVSFQPGARTAWHTHPLGQTLIVTAGNGLAQVEGEAIRPLAEGDVVWFEPGEKHWHGAAPDSAMTHIALQEAQDGNAVTWLEHVTDAQYAGG